jgi:predicted PurR-regulated permease PerM
MGSIFDNLGIRKRFAILLGIFVLGFAFFGLWSFKTLNELQVSGPLFQRIVKNKDLVADTLQEIVQSIKRVSDIVGEISLASSEQSIGVNQVGEAVTEMDHTTQQNAALVEEMASAAMSLKRQANELVASVAVFTLPAGKDLSANRLCFSPGLAPASY